MSNTFNSEDLQILSQLGNALGPIFLRDPKDNQDVVRLMRGLKEYAQANTPWPYIDDEDSLARYFSQLSSWSGELEKGLYDDYRRLFVGPGHIPAPPYVSAYTDPDLVMFGKTCLELKDWLKRNGIVMHSENMPEDHLGRLLMLMAWLTEHKPEILEEFLEEHFLPLGDYIFEKIEAEAHHPVYISISGIAKETLRGIVKTYDLHPRHLRSYR